MSKKSNQHVVPRGNNWAVQGAGNSRATAIVSTQQIQQILSVTILLWHG